MAVADEQRKEKRIPIDSVVLPFIGSRVQDYSGFQYLIQDVSRNGLKIALPRWLVSREKLHQGDRVNFHVPFAFEGEFFNLGRIMWAKWDDSIEAQVCGVLLDKKSPVNYPVYISLESRDVAVDLAGFASREKLALKVLKDSILLKKGILIYLRHLTPYFSRIVEIASKDYDAVQDLLFDDVRAKVQANTQTLQDIHQNVLDSSARGGCLAEALDLEELRAAVDPEIYMDIFTFALETEKVVPYFKAVKDLEKKLYSNYNTLVMIYIRCL